MKIETLKEQINEILENNYSCQVYLVLRQNNTLTLKLADIEDNATLPEIENMFTSSIQETILNNDVLQICQLSTADERSNAIYQYDYKDYPEELDLFRNFNIKDSINETEKFNFHDDNLSSLFGYIIYIGSMKQGILLFKKHYPISLIGRDSFLLGVKKSKKRFEKISGEDILRMNGSFQLIRVNDSIYVTYLKTLEQTMGFTHLIQREAGKTIDAIKTLDILEDIEVLEDTMAENSFARKLSKVYKSSPIFTKKIPKTTIIEFTKTTPALANKFKYSDDGNYIRLDTKKSKDAFIKLMNDSFLCSELTKSYYEALAKDDITA